jgi:hypothetical protein
MVAVVGADGLVADPQVVVADRVGVVEVCVEV